MRTRSSTVGTALWVVGLCLLWSASPAEAAPKKKKGKAAAAAEEAPAAEPKDKSVDDLMSESATTRKASASDSKAGSESAGSTAAEAEVAEPDAWERPPMDEEKPKPVEAPKVEEEKYGDGNQLEIGITAGYGLNAGDADWTTSNPYGLGFGLRGGYELDNRIFLGAGAKYYIGSSALRSSAMGEAIGAARETKQSYLITFVEGGYDFWFGDLILRPSIWLGMGFAFVDPHYQTMGLKTVSDFMLAPGLMLNYVFDDLFLGGDLRWEVVTADGAKGLSLFAVFGLRF